MTNTSYRPVVGANNTTQGFRTSHAPVNLTPASFGTPYEVKRIDCEIFDDESGHWKFFLPPGTVAFNANLYYFYVAQEGKVVLRFNTPPTTPLGIVTAAHAGGSINESVLLRLIAGQEVLNYSPGLPANSLALSSPDNPIEPMKTGGYVYGDFQYPGGRLQRGLLQVFVKADDYAQWYANAKWDADGNPDENGVPAPQPTSVPTPSPTQAPSPTPVNVEQTALARAMGSGLADALRRFGKCENDDELIDRVVSSGVWSALLEFQRLSEINKK